MGTIIFINEITFPMMETLGCLKPITLNNRSIMEFGRNAKQIISQHIYIPQAPSTQPLFLWVSPYHHSGQ